MAGTTLILLTAVLLWQFSDAQLGGRSRQGLPSPRQPGQRLPSGGLAGYRSSGQTLPGSGGPRTCGTEDESKLFNDCLLFFGLAHLKDRSAMSSSSTCLKEKLQCPAAGTAITCINGFADTDLSRPCWISLKKTLGDLMMKHGFGCNYTDVETHCWRKIPQLKNRGFSANRG